MKKSPLYTQTGDAGQTSLVGGVRVAKTHPRIEAYGTVDELNAHLGLLCTEYPADAPQIGQIRDIQNQLFRIGAYLATDAAHTSPAAASYILPDDIARLEHWIDETDAQLPPLRAFLLPGGGRIAAQAHVARTVCRRAERQIVSLFQEIGVEQNIQTYMNRLSDYLFVIARMGNFSEKNEEILWDSARK
ncbi:MAG: cob(I)yrinic acid a,c-diamide adenosyltransferase [Bacteroidaceae bacterium]|jgi:cob(I)alamin adenosyltransferase